MIFVLEDDKSIRDLTVYALCSAGYEAKGFEAPSYFWAQLENELPELLLLDIMLPEEDGVQILKKLRTRKDTANLPIILLTAKNTEYDKVIGLDSGADDYISKPFGMMELISRIKALLRRTSYNALDDEKIYEIDGLYVNISSHKVKVYGQDIILTLKEFELLCLLLNNRGIVLNRDVILQKIWGIDYDGENRTVDVHIRMLRSKLGECGKIIETIRGIGYKIDKSIQKQQV